MQNLRGSLKKLLENNLVLNRGQIQAGAGEYRHKFLCASVGDEELPWDQDQEDW
jgi:hypothetical protein